MKRLWTWMRVISPAEYVFGATVALGVFFLLLITAIGLVAEAFPGLRKTSEPFDWSMYRWVPLALPQVAGIAYGSLRAAYFHPLRREAYLRWLRTTPWAPPRPLPLGPATLCGQDAVWLAVFAALVGPSGFPLAILGPVVLGLAAYAFVSVRTLRAAGPYWAAYASMFASVALVFVAFRGGTLAFLRYLQELAELESVRSVAVTLMLHGAMAAALFVVIVVVTQIGLRQQLRRVPWDAEALPPTVRRQRGATLAQHWQKVHRLGWPLCELNPQRDDTSRYGPFERMAATLLLGWIAALIAATARLITPEALDSLAEDPNKARHAAVVFSAFPLAAAWPFFILRLTIRCSQYRPPCDLLGRFESGRWILRGYDRLFAVPVLALLLAAIGVGLSFSPLGGSLLTFVFATAIALLAFFGPPEEETFRLTGQYRLPKPSGVHSEPSPRPPRTHFWG